MSTQNPDLRQRTFKTLITRGREVGFLIRAETLSSLSIAQIDADQAEDVLAMIEDMDIPIFESPPTEAELAAWHRLRAESASDFDADHGVPSAESANNDVPVADPIVVLKVGAEGGSIHLLGQQTTVGWRFRYSLLDQSARWLDEGDADVRRQSHWVRDWNDALVLLGRYPWVALHPLEVHVDFRGRVLTAVQERLSTTAVESSVHRRLAEWLALCG